jgi:hypothetical protein
VSQPATVRTWPVWVLAAPAAVAIWSGWVGLGQMTGFGKINPLPGTPLASWELDTAITLPIGMEVYAAYALWVWLSGQAPEAAARFARLSAIGALALGAAGQVAYHLMAAAGWSRAPWWITTVVACLPVAVLGMGAALRHLIHAAPAAESPAVGAGEAPAAGPQSSPGAPSPVPGEAKTTVPGDATGAPPAATKAPRGRSTNTRKAKPARSRDEAAQAYVAETAKPTATGLGVYLRAEGHPVRNDERSALLAEAMTPPATHLEAVR